MKIRVDEALRLSEKYGADDVQMLYLQDIFVNTRGGVMQITHGMKFESDHAEFLQNAGIREIEVIYTERLFAKLSVNFAEEYRLPLGRISFMEMDRLIDAMDLSNNATKRKRTIISLSEFYRKNNLGIYEPLLRYGEKLTRKRWNEIKGGLNRNAQFDYRFDECGIIVYCLLNPGHPQYAQKYLRFTEVVSLIVEQRKITDTTISPDFIPDSDVYPVTDKNELLTVYNDKKPALIIVVDELDDEYKQSLAQIKLFDKYARLMVIKNPDPAHKKEIMATIKSIYLKNLWQES